jgi:hypothetical protein
MSHSRTLAPLLDRYPSATVEFGVIIRGSEIIVYLIDWVEGAAESYAPRACDLEAGIVSIGAASGQIRVIDQDDSSAHLNQHHDEIQELLDQGRIGIDPFEPELLKRNSYVLRLGGAFRRISGDSELDVADSQSVEAHLGLKQASRGRRSPGCRFC